MVVTPNLLVDILLGTDIYEAEMPNPSQVKQGLAVLTRAQRRGREQEIQLRPDCQSQAMRNGSSQLWDDEEQRGKENEQTQNCQRMPKRQLRHADERNCLTIATLHKWRKAVKSWLLKRQTTRD